MRWLLIAIALLVVGVPVAMRASVELSLDRKRAHAQATAALPLVGPGREGLVRIRVRGLEFRARVSGLGNPGAAVLMLHGFPETSIMWEPLLEAAAARGMRAVAFDQRGYSPGARPESLSSYALRELVDDARAVADALGFDRFHLVGHDWGSMVGWALAASEPARVRSFASLSIPHPGAIVAERGDAGPPLYIRIFRLPGVAETLLGLNGFWGLQRGVYSEMPPDVLAEYLAVFSEPGALTAALRWYRAIPFERGASALGGAAAIGVPVLYVFGNRDMPVFVGPAVRARQAEFVKGPYREVELDAGHWLMQEERERVVREILAHLAAYAHT
jgi:pimeloyl-ACP methyl ester carboxylesterase